MPFRDHCGQRSGTGQKLAAIKSESWRFWPGFPSLYICIWSVIPCPQKGDYRKMKPLFMSVIVMFSSVLAFAGSPICRPESNQTRWRDAEVSYLSNATQWLFQIRASGTYLAADFICSDDRCTGFINGTPATAHLDLDPKDSSKVSSLTIDGNSALTKVKFFCD